MKSELQAAIYRQRRWMAGDAPFDIYGAYGVEQKVYDDLITIRNAYLAAAPVMQEMREALRALPAFDLECPDAADFKDNAGAFIRAMKLGRAALAHAEALEKQPSCSAS